MSDQRIFDDVARTNSEPSRGEDSFTFLNRAATRYWERVRAFVDESFSTYPQEHGADLRSRFRDRRWSMHIGAWWELYLFRLFRALGAEIEVHPELPSVDTRPDFRLSIDDEVVLIEARHVAAGVVSDERSRGRDDWITDPLDTLWHPNFMVAVRILSRGSRQPRRAAVTRGVLEWLDTLDPDDIAAQPVQGVAPFHGGAGDWRFELTPLAMRAKARGNRRRHLVGVFPGRSGMDNTATALRAALKEKAGKYGRPDESFLIAPLLTSGSVDTEDVVSALYGTEVVAFPVGQPDQARLDRRADGFWRFGTGFRGTRVSGVLIGDAILPWTAGAALPRLWVHPAAAVPLPCTFGLPTAAIDPTGSLAMDDGDRTAAEVFGLDPRWPGPEPPFP